MNRVNTTDILGAVSPSEFLREYWQKKPLLIEQAIPEFQSPITPNELAGLTLDDEVESRLILEKNGATPWQVIHGPMEEEHFKHLGESHWTLLVQEANRHIPEVARLLDCFDFIPSWRIDDIMISFAPPGGSVGPHTDQYDVFLLQAYGERRWSLSFDKVSDSDYQQGLEHRVLKSFQAEQEFLLKPGDMLYLPPGVIHHGVAESDCMTFSIGLRAPTNHELLSGIVPHLLETIGERRYRDPELSLPAHPGILTNEALTQLRGLIRDTLADDDCLNEAIALSLSESVNTLSEQPDYETDWLESLRSGTALLRNEDYRLVLAQATAGNNNLDNYTLYVNGQQFSMSPLQAPFVMLLCDHRRLSADMLLPHLPAGPSDNDANQDNDAAELNQWLLDALLQAGYLYLELSLDES